MTANTYVTEDCYRITYYLYNASSVEVNHTTPGGGLTVLQPHSWTRVDAAYWMTSWPQTYKNESNQWLVDFHFKFMGESATGYDIYLTMSYQLGQSH
jgi:hypothetical protein